MTDPNNFQRVLVVRPPQVLSYFNAGHHLALHQVAEYLRLEAPQALIREIDYSVQRTTWRDVAADLHQNQYRIIAIMNDLDGTEGVARLVDYARSILPCVKIATFGRLSGLRPAFFERYDIDGIVESGDFETGIKAFADAVATRCASAPGVRMRSGGRWVPPITAGTYLDAWPLPPPHAIPYDSYDELYRDDQRKFSGLPGKRELVVPVARGCPVGCAYCEVPPVFGKAERRLPVATVLSYIERCFAEGPFEYVSFYAPTFTLNKRWVRELCDALQSRRRGLAWKCCTTMHHLDRDLILAMGASGCVRISVGLETLDEKAYAGLPRVKRKEGVDLETVASACREAGVELNCFVIVGLPGTTVASAERTIARAQAVGARVRPTVYTPYETITELSQDSDVRRLNRQTLPAQGDLDEHDRHRAYALMYGEAT